MVQASEYAHTTTSARPDDALDMTIDQSPEVQVALMQALTNLYSNPRQAVIREVISNALDSHQRVGQTTPVNVTFNLDAGTFIVHDQGEGMSREDVEDIYSRYGSSRSRTNRQSRGGFGLGAKSALAVADKFDVHTVKDGVALTFTVHRGGYTTPSYVTFQDETSTDLPNGTTVIITSSVFVGDNKNFKHPDWLAETDQTLAAIPNSALKMNVSGFNSQTLRRVRVPVPNNPLYTAIGENFTGQPLGWLGQANSQIALAVGHDYYVLSSTELKEIFDSGFIPVAAVLNMPFGSVQFPPDRESLILTETTKSNIREFAEQFREGVLEHYQQRVNEEARSGAEAYTISYHQFLPSNYLHKYVEGRSHAWFYNGTVIAPVTLSNEVEGFKSEDPIDVLFSRETSWAANFRRSPGATPQKSGKFPRYQHSSSAWPLENIQPLNLNFIINDLEDTDALLDVPSWTILSKVLPEDVAVFVLINKDVHGRLTPWAQQYQTLPVPLSELFIQAKEARSAERQRSVNTGQATPRPTTPAATSWVVATLTEPAPGIPQFELTRVSRTDDLFKEAVEFGNFLDTTRADWDGFAPKKWTGIPGETVEPSAMPLRATLALQYLLKVLNGQTRILLGGPNKPHREFINKNELTSINPAWVKAVIADLTPGAAIYHRDRDQTLPLGTLHQFLKIVDAGHQQGLSVNQTADEQLLRALSPVGTPRREQRNFPHPNYKDGDEGHQQELLRALLHQFHPLASEETFFIRESNMLIAHEAQVRTQVSSLLSRLPLLSALNAYTDVVGNPALLAHLVDYWNQHAK